MKMCNWCNPEGEINGTLPLKTNPSTKVRKIIRILWRNFWLCYGNLSFRFTCLVQWSPVPDAARDRRRETSSSYHSNFLLSSGSLPLLVVVASSFLQGSMIFAYFSAIHTIEAGWVPTVMSRDMNPSSINSTWYSSSQCGVRIRLDYTKMSWKHSVNRERDMH